MKIRRAIVAAAMLSVGLGLRAQEAGNADWWAAQRELSGLLVDRKMRIEALVDRAAAAPPATAPQAMLKVAVLMRAGMGREAVAMLKELQRLAPDLDSCQVSDIYYEAFDTLHQADIAQGVLEIFAGTVCDVSLENRLLSYRLENGWSEDRVDRWLADKPAGRENFWIKERVRFNVRRGRGEPLIRDLAEAVRRNPADVAGAIAFLDILCCARHESRAAWDVSWIAGTVKPGRTTDCEKMASRLKDLACWDAAASCYGCALGIPLAEDESLKLGMMCQVKLPQATLEAMFAVNLREALSECLLNLDRREEAQRRMVEAADLRGKNGLGMNALLAGRVQGASGQRVIEGRIRVEEKKSEDDPDYWRERATYYRGRKETAREEEAWRKGLALIAPRPGPEPRAKSAGDPRRWMLDGFAQFLIDEGRQAEAFDLLRREIETAPPSAPSAEGAARMLAMDLGERVRADDEVLWTWLAARDGWDDAEERLLWKMLENAKRDELQPCLARAEKLAAGSHPGRALVLGWILNRMHFPERSIPLLEYALKHAPKPGDFHEKAAFSLFESYLDAGDWKSAEALFPRARARLTAGELSDWYGRIARVAAKAGAKEEALRIWKDVVNVNPSETGALRDLVAAGLAKELGTLYRELQKRLPASDAPARALRLIGE
jgi:tetratricopeptide (TPR) repeat protein